MRKRSLINLLFIYCLEYKASYAFDKNLNTAWYPSGYGKHDNNDDWIAYEFSVAVRIHAIRMINDANYSTAAPRKILVEASDKKYGPFEQKWTIHNPSYKVDGVYRILRK